MNLPSVALGEQRSPILGDLGGEALAWRAERATKALTGSGGYPQGPPHQASCTFGPEPSPPPSSVQETAEAQAIYFSICVPHPPKAGHDPSDQHLRFPSG